MSEDTYSYPLDTSVMRATLRAWRKRADTELQAHDYRRQVIVTYLSDNIDIDTLQARDVDRIYTAIERGFRAQQRGT